MKKHHLFALITGLLFSARLAFGTTTAYTNAIVGDHPVSFWPLNETSGTLIHDIVGTNNATAMNVGSMTLGSPGILYSNGLTTDTCINFLSGGSPYIYIPWATNLNSPLMAISVEGWFKLPASFPGGAADIGMMSCNSSCAQGWAWMIHNSSPYQVQSWLGAGAPGSGTQWEQPAYGNSSPGHWVHFVTTYDGTTTRLYTNGVQANSVTMIYKPETQQDRGEMLLGAYEEDCPPAGAATEYYQGGMENVAFYNYALSAAQVANHYMIGTNGSGGSISNPPSITTQPLSQTNFVTQTANFSVTAGGLPPLYYQWYGGTTGSGIYTNLIAGGQFSVVTNPAVSISGLGFGNAGDYVVIVTNSLGSITSSVATLTILSGAPGINQQPASETNYVGLTATFAIGATGVSPLSYQWQAAVTGSGIFTNLPTSSQVTTATTNTVNITTLTLGNAADYRVIVTNVSGSITSSVANLVVLTNAPVSSYQTEVLSDNPVAYWPLQETVGPTFQDIVGGYTGTLFTSTDGTVLTKNQHTNFVSGGAVSSDGLTYQIGGPGPLTGVAGDLGVYFTNLNTSVNSSDIVVPYNAAYDPPATFTAEAWVNVPVYPIGYTQNNYETVLGLEANAGAQNGWWFDLETDGAGGGKGSFQFNLAEPPGAHWTSPTSGVNFSGQWVHAVEVCIGGTNMICYTNGVQMFNTTWPTNNYISEGTYGTHKLPFVIGSYCANYGVGQSQWGFERGNFWHGGVSHVALYTNALAANRVMAHFLARTNPVVVIPPPPTMSIRYDGTNVTVNWTSGTLQQVGDLTGSWSNVSGAVSPYTTGASNSALFFRATQ